MSENIKTMFEMLSDQYQMNLKLCDQLINALDRAEKNYKSGKELVEECGGLTIQWHLHRKINAEKEVEHLKDIKRIDQKTEKLILLNEQERLYAQRHNN
jgi:hypothetical protein